MSPISATASMRPAPVNPGRMLPRAGDITAIATSIITTGTGTTGTGRAFVRE